jgi:hypothetical protein
MSKRRTRPMCVRRDEGIVVGYPKGDQTVKEERGGQDED